MNNQGVSGKLNPANLPRKMGSNAAIKDVSPKVTD